MFTTNVNKLELTSTLFLSISEKSFTFHKKIKLKAFNVNVCLALPHFMIADPN